MSAASCREGHECSSPDGWAPRGQRASCRARLLAVSRPGHPFPGLKRALLRDRDTACAHNSPSGPARLSPFSRTIQIRVPTSPDPQGPSVYQALGPFRLPGECSPRRYPQNRNPWFHGCAPERGTRYWRRAGGPRGTPRQGGWVSLAARPHALPCRRLVIARDGPDRCREIGARTPVVGWLRWPERYCTLVDRAALWMAKGPPAAPPRVGRPGTRGQYQYPPCRNAASCRIPHQNTRGPARKMSGRRQNRCGFDDAVP
jgi:hypothetical protein